MAFFGELRGDVSPRIRLAKMKPEFDRRLESYNNGFNINVSRIKPISKDSKESMLTYSERMQNISKTRKTQQESEDRSLEVRAHKISKKYKFRETLPDRKVLSLEQLVGRRKERKERPQSLDEVTLRRQSIRGKHGVSKTRTPRGIAVLPSLPNKPQKNIKVSFVNASDLYDFVDCNIRTPCFKSQPLGHIQREHDQQKLNHSETQSTPEHSAALDARLLPPITIYLKQRDEHDNRELYNKFACDEIPLTNILEGEANCLPSQMQQLKIRPRRAKRMTLPKSGLYSIPETDCDLKREVSLSNSFRWASSQRPLYLPRQNSPEDPIETKTPRVDKSQTDVRVGMKIRPYSEPQTDVQLDADYEDDFEDDHGFYEEDSFSSVSEDESNFFTKSPQYTHIT